MLADMLFLHYGHFDIIFSRFVSLAINIFVFVYAYCQMICHFGFAITPLLLSPRFLHCRHITIFVIFIDRRHYFQRHGFGFNISPPRLLLPLLHLLFSLIAVSLFFIFLFISMTRPLILILFVFISAYWLVFRAFQLLRHITPFSSIFRWAELSALFRFSWWLAAIMRLLCWLLGYFFAISSLLSLLLSLFSAGRISWRPPPFFADYHPAVLFGYFHFASLVCGFRFRRFLFSFLRDCLPVRFFISIFHSFLHLAFSEVVSFISYCWYTVSLFRRFIF